MQRRDAELWYVSHIHSLLQQQSTSTEEVDKVISAMETREPRWKDLRDQSREDLLQQLCIPKQESNLKNKFLSITLRSFPSAESIQSLTPTECQTNIPSFQMLPTWPLKLARGKILRALGLNRTARVKLWAILSDSIRVEMDDDFMEVQRYGICSGDEVWILTDPS